MGIVSQNRRLKRLEAVSTTTQPLFYELHQWASGGPIEKGVNDDDETIAKMKAEALDRLVAAGEITDEDRARVRFIVYIAVKPTRPEQLEPYGTLNQR